MHLLRHASICRHVVHIRTLRQPLTFFHILCPPRSSTQQAPYGKKTGFFCVDVMDWVLPALWDICDAAVFFQADTIIMISPSDSMPYPFDASQHNDKSELPTSMTRLSILIFPCMTHISLNGKDVLLDTCLHFSSLFMQHWVHWSF